MAVAGRDLDVGGGVVGVGEGVADLGAGVGLASHIRTGLVQVHGVDLKGGMEFVMGRALFTRYAQQADQAVVMLEDAAAAMQARARWRAEIGFRFASVLAGLVPDHELHAPGRVHAAPPRKARRRRVLVTVNGAVDGRLDQLVDLLITRLGRDENHRSPTRAGFSTAPSQRQAA